MMQDEPTEPTSYLRELTTIIGLVLFLGAMVALTSCGGRTPRKCGTIISKWSEPTFRSQDILYMATIKGDDGGTYSVSCGRNSWGSTLEGGRICGDDMTNY